MISICSWTGQILCRMSNYFCAAHKGDFSYKLLTRKYIFQLTRYEHKGISESTDFDDTNFSSAGIAG